jgi:hypothetical protein
MVSVPQLALLINSLRLLSESELLYDWRCTANQFFLATSPLRPTTRIFIFQLHACGYSLDVTSSLTRRLVCRLQLLLGLASAVILRSESRGTNDHVYCLRFQTPPTWRTRFLYLYPQDQGGPVIPPPTFLSLHIEYFIRHGLHRRHYAQQSCCCMCIRCPGSVFTKPLTSNIVG